jgi:putative tryptophan/tyrosine transport system permease protein
MIQTLIDALQQTFIFIPLTLGIYLSYELLKVTDLTPDGTFVLGAAIFTRLLTDGYNQYTSLFFALIGGAIAGVGVALLQRYAKINSLIASILAVFMLYSINFAVMQRPNIGILNYNTFINQIQDGNQLLFNSILFIIALILVFAMFLLVKSKLGLTIRGFGSNKQLLPKLGINPTLYLIIGLAISNMLAALCGVLTAQINGYSDIHMGLGMALIGIGAVVIGCKLIRTLFRRSESFNITADLIGCFVGTYIYFLMLNTFLMIGINPIYLKLVLGLTLALFLSTANYSRKQHQSVIYND